MLPDLSTTPQNLNNTTLKNISLSMQDKKKDKGNVPGILKDYQKDLLKHTTRISKKESTTTTFKERNPHFIFNDVKNLKSDLNKNQQLVLPLFKNKFVNGTSNRETI